MERFSSRRMTRKEQVLKREVDAYHVSEVDSTAVLHCGSKAMEIYQSLDLPDAECDGLMFKRRLVETKRGDCLLLARWKPERHMRRKATEWSQKWFVEKRLFPPDRQRLFSHLEQRVKEGAEGTMEEEG
jgi:hypothetical protein